MRESASSKRLLFCLKIIGSLRPAFAQQQSETQDNAKKPRHETIWRIEPSFKFDTLCLLNTLTGDPYYLTYYSKAYDEFAPKLTPEAKAALAGLKAKIKDEGQGIISANLCLLFSVTDDASLDDLLATIQKPDKLREGLSKTPYWSEETWAQFAAVQGDLRTVFTWLKQIGFEEYWREKVEPIAAARAREMQSMVAKFDIVPAIEVHFGTPLESNTVTVYMLTFSQPHGIKITGTRFLTDVAWPFKIVVRNAVHEMMHPPYKLQGDPELHAFMETLRGDKFVMDKVENHNPSFGYNTLEGFVDEDCVQALDQLINERLGVAADAKGRWKASDDGMHVLAIALYRMMKGDGYPTKDRSFRDYLVRMHKEGKFAPGRIESQFRSMYNN